MATNQEIPLIVNPRYTFTTELDGATYRLSIRWNSVTEAWYVDLLGITDSSIDYRGIKLTTGPNLLKPFAILQLGAMYIFDNEGLGEDPTYDDIGGRFQLIYVPAENTDEII